VYFIVFFILVFFVISCGSPTPKEDIVRLRCARSRITFSHIFYFEIFLNF